MDLFQNNLEDFVALYIDYGLFLIEWDLNQWNYICADFGMPFSILNKETHRVNHLISDKLAYDLRLKAEI